MKRVSKETKENIINQFNNGVSVTSLTETTGIPRSTIYGWLKSAQIDTSKKPVNKKRIRDLESSVTRLSTIVEILQRVFEVESIPTCFRLEEIEKIYGEYNVHNLCEALKVPRATFYNHIKRNKRTLAWYAVRREELREQIQEIYFDNKQIFGSKKIAAVLKSRGVKVSVEMVRELMKDMGLISIREGAKDDYDKEKMKYKNYLNQQFDTSRPNEVWVGDVTYFRLKEKNYYICVIIDLFSRKVVGYKIGMRNSTQLTKSTFKLAYQSRTPKEQLMFHSDNGGNYRSKAFCEYLKTLNVKQSFSRAHIPYDNSVVESFFANMKREELYRTKFNSEKDFRTGVDNYIKYYNENRPHSKNRYKTPNEKERDYFSKHGDYSN